MKILMVCLGNICRSPMAEGILRQKLKEKKIKAEIDSAGTGAMSGYSPDKRSIATCKEFGIDISNLIARQFVEGDFDLFDKIFVMDKSNMRFVLSLARNESDRAKVDLLLNVDKPNSERSVPDPYYGDGNEGFYEVYEMIDKACDALAEQIKNGNK